MFQHRARVHRSLHSLVQVLGLLARLLLHGEVRDTFGACVAQERAASCSIRCLRRPLRGDGEEVDAGRRLLLALGTWRRIPDVRHQRVYRVHLALRASEQKDSLLEKITTV